MIFYIPLCNKHCNGTFEICLLMCATTIAFCLRRPPERTHFCMLICPVRKIGHLGHLLGGIYG